MLLANPAFSSMSPSSQWPGGPPNVLLPSLSSAAPSSFPLSPMSVPGMPSSSLSDFDRSLNASSLMHVPAPPPPEQERSTSIAAPTATSSLLPIESAVYSQPADTTPLDDYSRVHRVMPMPVPSVAPYSMSPMSTGGMNGGTSRHPHPAAFESSMTTTTSAVSPSSIPSTHAPAMSGATPEFVRISMSPPGVSALDMSQTSDMSGSWLSTPSRAHDSLHVRHDTVNGNGSNSSSNGRSYRSPKARPFVCSHCSRAFSRRHDLERHARVHSGDRPYVCRVCQKGFPRSDALRRHIRVERDTHESYFVSKTSDVLDMSDRDTHARHN
ncbi:hypothetical protein MGL_0144 [Malassezia globosa CBS 7966]|uniref:C2H2-type domain-containing protein n=1 Tax=Malassezia globosa (strain ATCC MYA-4612 / CBS 7966) TaxID=425265 RepID=A8PRW7_MALGO|nr:uncharacterized protein MGL_0144 [Malassezia globosa CBS 7966]EDP45155.1 hypothetical protein MGL_0144 [Malassezia globosa CBS 7966]